MDGSWIIDVYSQYNFIDMWIEMLYISTQLMDDMFPYTFTLYRASTVNDLKKIAFGLVEYGAGPSPSCKVKNATHCCPSITNVGYLFSFVLADSKFSNGVFV